MPSDIEHWYINATVYKDRVEEIHYISDPARNIRRRPHTKVWQVEQFLGRGGFGEVRLERNKEDDKVRAVKRIVTASTMLSNSKCERELKALLEFSKPKSREAAVFVDFFGWFKDGSDLFLAMEYVQLGDLERNLPHSGKISEIEVRDIAKQILSGLEIMHAESFAHRDLKPQNVLVVNGPPKWWVKLADFGLSKRLTDTTAYYTQGGTQLYMAPEVLNYLDANATSLEYTNAVDLWAVGCIVYRLITGAVPFPPGPYLVEYCKNKSLFPYDALSRNGVKSEGSKFIGELLVTNPKDRPSASEALQCQWIISDTNITSDSPDIPRRSQAASELLEPTLSKINYNTDSHNGLKSYRSISPSQTASSQSSAADVPHVKEKTKEVEKDSATEDSYRSHSHLVHRKRRDKDNSLMAMAMVTPRLTPSSPKTPYRHDSGIRAGRASSSHRKDRTPEEQAAHEMRKAARRAAKLKSAESESAVADGPADVPVPSSEVSRRMASRRHTTTHRSKEDGDKRLKLLDMMKWPFIAKVKNPITERPKFSSDGERPIAATRKERDEKEKHRAEHDREARRAIMQMKDDEGIRIRREER